MKTTLMGLMYIRSMSQYAAGQGQQCAGTPEAVLQAPDQIGI